MKTLFILAVKEKRMTVLLLEDDFVAETEASYATCRKGEVLIEEGAKSSHFFYLLKGEVSVYNLTETGKVFLHHRVKEKNFFGEPAVFLDIPFPGYINVLSKKAEILLIKRIHLIEYLKNHPDWAIEFIKSMAEKSWKKSELLNDIVFLSPEERIVRLFDKYKKNSLESIKIPLTRSEVSKMTGLRIETVIRTIRRMDKEGKLTIVKGKVFY